MGDDTARPNERIITNAHGAQHTSKRADLYTIADFGMTLCRSVVAYASGPESNTAEDVAVVADDSSLANYSADSMIDNESGADAATKMDFRTR